ncbi:hypothetical protein ACQ4M3_35295 [Leptolyngbya sp. AN03gr2]|uniref:hypothetical protein n=1 Tax=unclassified Leptolyngbya TaxID=2650499 RepID=UPI003D31423D
MSNPSLDQNEIKILKAIEQRPRSIEDLVYIVRNSTEQVSSTVQSLWKRGYIDYINTNPIAMLFPQLRRQQRQSHSPEPVIPLGLTSAGYFALHPIITPSPS